jgi:hypothetical protein
MSQTREKFAAQVNSKISVHTWKRGPSRQMRWVS